MLKQNYKFVDLTKFLFALLIVASHYVNEWCSNVNKYFDLFVSFYIVVVPFFFVCSGYLLFNKYGEYKKDDLKYKQGIIEYCKKIFVMYIKWSVIYVLFNILTWMKFGVSTGDVLNYLHSLFVYSSYKTIWFLPALVVGVAIVYIIDRFFDSKTVILVALLLYVIGSMGVTYRFVPDSIKFIGNIYNLYDKVFITTRNGLFNGFPFVAIGYYIAKNKNKICESFFNKNLFLSLIFTVLFVAEAFLLKYRFDADNANTLLLLLPFSYYFFMWT